MSAKKNVKTVKKAASSETKLVRRENQWWIVGLAKSDYGPYETKKDAEAEARSLRKAHAEAKPEDAPKPTTAKGKVKADAPAKGAKTPRGKKGAKAGADAKPKRTSALDAAAALLAETGQPMNTREMIEAMAANGSWSSPNGRTPHATLYSAILRELNTKGKDARFVKTERGKFAAKK